MAQNGKSEKYLGILWYSQFCYLQNVELSESQIGSVVGNGFFFSCNEKCSEDWGLVAAISSKQLWDFTDEGIVLNSHNFSLL